MPSAGIAAVLVGITIAAVLYYFIGSTEEQPSAHNPGRRSNGSYNSGQYSSIDSDQWNRYSNIENRIRSGICSICLESLTTATRVILKPCDHIFHKECIMGWITTANQQLCPNCRSTFTYNGLVI